MSSKYTPVNTSPDRMEVPSALGQVLAGAAFGAALTYSGVYTPAVIVSQMQLRNFHMLQTFLAASATSALIVQYATKTGHCPPQTRHPDSFAGLPRYFGNIIGGSLIGSGMALTGGCPGTIVVQGTVGMLSGLQAGIGGLLGGMAFVELAPWLKHTNTALAGGKPKPPPVQGPEAAEQELRQQPAPTIAAQLGWKITTVVWTYEAMCFAMIALATRYASNSSPYSNPILGGLAIGAAQALSVLLSRKTIGFSDAYVELGRDFWSIILPSSHARATSHAAVWFAIGLIAGAKALATQMPMLVPSGEVPQIGKISALIGGFTMVFGAHLADGCPSGHGISGLATFSLPSFVTVAAMFAGGIAMKALIG